MKWRVLVLLAAGMAMIYFVSLLQDTPYPHPAIIQTFNPSQSRIKEPTQVILTAHDQYIYRTHIHYEAVLDTNRGFVHGVESIKVGVNGLVIQMRRRKSEFLKEEPEEEWETCFEHLLRGPISKTSKSAEESESLQFAVLYHTYDNDNIEHFARVYYIAVDQTGHQSFEYKDLKLPGNTMINAISLEQDSILYSRDPDVYRFRIANLPHQLLYPPHSENASPIVLSDGQTGELAKQYHQPKETELHTTLLCKLYSPNVNTYRVFTLDVHKTRDYFHTNVTITDGTISSNQGIKVGQWIQRDHLNATDNTIIDENLEFMPFVDGAHFHHERTVINMPIPSISRSKDAKTMVISLIRNDFQTLDFTDNLNALDKRHMYRYDNQQVIPEFYHAMQVPDSIEPSSISSSDSTAAYDSKDIRGVQLNGNATLLTVWTESNSIYIYKRGASDDEGLKQKLPQSPHYLEKPLEWILRMVITPKEGYIGSITPIGATLFWANNGSTYISVGMKNDIVNTYMIDEMEEQKAVNFKTFLKDKWDLWIVMTMIVIIFVVNEYKTYSI